MMGDGNERRRRTKIKWKKEKKKQQGRQQLAKQHVWQVLYIGWAVHRGKQRDRERAGGKKI